MTRTVAHLTQSQNIRAQTSLHPLNASPSPQFRGRYVGNFAEATGHRPGRAVVVGAGTDDSEQRAVVDRYAAAFQAADVPALVRLLAEDAVMEMPPVPLWLRGRAHWGILMGRVFRTVSDSWITLPITANSQPALACYAPEPSGEYVAHTLQVFTVASGLITGLVVFGFGQPRLWEAFGLPERLPADEFPLTRKVLVG